MNVAYVLKRYPRLSQTFVVNEIRAHEAAGLPLSIETLRLPAVEDDRADVRGVCAPVHRLSGEPQVQAEELARRIRSRGVQHLHAHFGNSAAEVARLAAVEAGIGYSFTAHARDIYLDDVDHVALARRLHEARHVITVSDHNRAHLMQRYGLPGARVSRLYNGLDLGRLAWRSPVEREPLVLAVGRLVEKKGFADLIDALALLGPGTRCVIAGGGPLLADLQAQADRLGVAERVQFLGAVEPAQVLRWMRRAAVLAAPCIVGADGDRDGLPTVLLEAMALGTPCVSTDVTGIPELVRDGATGLLVAQRAPVALAAALQRLIDGPDLRLRLALAARDLTAAEFDIHVNTARLRERFAEAIRSSAAAVGGPLDRREVA